MFANTFTSDDKYSFRNIQNFLQQLQTHLYEKRKKISGFFFEILKCVVNWQHFEKKDECPGLIISEINVSEGDSYWNV